MRVDNVLASWAPTRPAERNHPSTDSQFSLPGQNMPMNPVSNNEYSVDLLAMLQSYYGFHPQIVSLLEANATTSNMGTAASAHPIVVERPETSPEAPPVAVGNPHGPGAGHPIVVERPETSPEAPPVTVGNPHGPGAGHPIVVEHPEPSPKAPPGVVGNPHT